MSAIEAKHPGVCPECEETFDVGELIVRNPADTGWAHETCPEPPAPRPVCPECFLEIALSGSCGCPS